MTSLQPEHRDDNMMERFDRTGMRKFRARDAVIAMAATAVILVLFAGGSIEKQGEEMNPGIGRDLVLDVGRPAAWFADQLPFHTAAHTLTAWLSPDQNMSGPDTFVPVGPGPGPGPAPATAVQPVTPDAFDPTELGAPAPPRRQLHTLLVTGDSMSTPLDQKLAQTLAPEGVNVIRDPHIGTGVSKSILVDWGRLSLSQVKQDQPDAVVVFIGANEGFSMPGPDRHQVQCCGPEWTAIYATRVRTMMNTYRQQGRARIYWLTLPTPRERARAQIAKVVNAAINVGAEPWRSQIRVIDTVPVFTPGEIYRDSMTIGDQPTIVRESDGIHLNDAGSALADKLVLAEIDRDFTR
jgi:lysophospholipase L1-like esterase